MITNFVTIELTKEQREFLLNLLKYEIKTLIFNTEMLDSIIGNIENGIDEIEVT